jgi:Cu/Ag efflux pump CusA
VIGGLTVATIATLFFVPTVFSVLHRNRDSQAPETSGASLATL